MWEVECGLRNVGLEWFVRVKEQRDRMVHEVRENERLIRYGGYSFSVVWRI